LPQVLSSQTVAGACSDPVIAMISMQLREAMSAA
jgi:hypothetical protein